MTTLQAYLLRIHVKTLDFLATVHQAFTCFQPFPSVLALVENCKMPNALELEIPPEFKVGIHWNWGRWNRGWLSNYRRSFRLATRSQKWICLTVKTDDRPKEERQD